MKKNNIIILNLILILVIFFLANFFIFYFEIKNSYPNVNIKEVVIKYKNFLVRDISYKNSVETIVLSKNLRKIENKNSKKKPILLFGCSFTEGSGLSENETISYKLGKLTNRPIYNRGISGTGVQHMLFQLRNEDFYKIIPCPEYIIYIFMDGHTQRIFTPVTLSHNPCYTVFYKDTKNGFLLKKRNFFTDKIIIQHYLSNQLTWNFLNRINSYNDYTENLLIDYIEESKKEAEKHWGKNFKFVVIFYRDPIRQETIKDLKKLGYITITKEDFKIDVWDKKFQISNTNEHPNGLAWDYITPIIIKKLNLL